MFKSIEIDVEVQLLFTIFDFCRKIHTISINNNSISDETILHKCNIREYHLRKIDNITPKQNYQEVYL